MRIGINLLHTHPGIGGAWNYIGNMLKALAAYDESNEYVVFYTDDSECLVPKRPNFTPVRSNLRSTNRPQRIYYEHAYLPDQARRHRLDGMHWVANTQALVRAVPGIVTVHDLRPIIDPGSLSPVYRYYLKAMIPRSVRTAARVLSVSRTTADDLERLLGVSPSRVSIIPNPVSPEFRPAPEESAAAFRRKYGLPERFWLYVAHYYSYKNHEGLFKACALRRSRQASMERSRQTSMERSRQTSMERAATGGGWPLVLRGEKNGADEALARMIKEAGIEKSVIWLPRLEDGEMPLLYSAATALVFPSFFEGGGIPVMEAMACGCPVAASDIPTTREFAGDAALLFDPHDPAEIARAMDAFESDEGLRARRREQGFRQVEPLRPERVAARLVAAYEEGLRPCRR